MKYLEFKKGFSKFPLIPTSHFYNITSNVQVLRNQLSLWQKRGLVIKLRKGLYLLNEEDREIQPSRIFLANQIYFPSYISLEYALNFYGLIPERVEDLTSVTTKKTASFENPFGLFRYQHIKVPLFFGFKKINDENNYPILFAEAEKAVLDFIYLRLAEFKDARPDIFKYSYRFQNTDILKKTKLKKMVKLYQSDKFHEAVSLFLVFLEEGL